jgi:uncharacterized protein YjiS (DUF1127 family)
MKENEEDTETVEVPLWLVRDSADLFGFLARRHYQNNSTTWADRYHGRARELNNVTDDEWTDVGIKRFEERYDI